MKRIKMLIARLSCVAYFCFIAAAATPIIFTGPDYLKPANVTTPHPHVRVGDIVLGGLFPIHQNTEGHCGRILDLGIQRAEAMVLAVDLVNKHPTLLPGVKLGFELRDTCAASAKALEESLHYLPVDSFDTDRHISGVVGAAASSVSISVAKLLRLFSIPQVSYASTCKLLSDKRRFSYFLRTVPPDLLQSRAIAAIIKYFHWTYVSVVSTAGAYGQSGIQLFIDEFTEVDNSSECKYCIAANVVLNLDASQEEYDSALDKLLEPWVSNASVVVLFGQLATAEGLMETVLRRKATDPSFNTSFLWIASDAWADTLPPKYYDAIDGFIGVSPDYLLSGIFDSYFTSLNPLNSKNPWFHEYWEDVFKCSLSQHGNNETKCDPSTQSLLDPVVNYRQNSKVTFTMDAVFAFAHAVQDMINVHCNGTTLCAEILDFNGRIKGKLLKDYLFNVSFQGFSSPFIRFDKNGNEKRGYVIQSLTRYTNNSSAVQIVGSWKDGVLNISDISRIKWNGQDGAPQSSFCSVECLFGEYREYIQSQAECCWTCQPCTGTKQVSDGIECKTCPPGYIPNTQLSDCQPIPPDYLHWTHPWAILIMMLSFAGCSVAAVMTIIWIIKWKTKVIKATSRELSGVMLGAIFLCYALPFFYIAQPSPAVCAMTRFGLGFCFSLCFGSLLVKTTRIHRIFNRKKASLKPPIFISPKSQMVFVGVIVLFQVAIAIIWLVFEQPDSVLIPSDYSVDLRCTANVYAGLSVSLTYNGILLACSTFFAFRTRHVPSEFNETKLIGLCCYTICTIWAVFIPSYFGTAALGGMFTASSQVMAIVLSATCILGTLFMPKIYLLFCKKTEHDETTIQLRTGQRASIASLGGCTCHSGSTASTTYGCRKKTYAGSYSF